MSVCVTIRRKGYKFAHHVDGGKIVLNGNQEKKWSLAVIKVRSAGVKKVPYFWSKTVKIYSSLFRPKSLKHPIRVQQK